MSEATAMLHAVRASTQDLLQGLDDEKWSEADMRAPSLCPGWTRAHVLTHLARNADSIALTLSGALRGEIVPRYPDGDRDEAIEAGVTRTMAQLFTDVAESARRLDRVLGAVDEADAWAWPTWSEVPAARRLEHRLREVEIHRVDLAGSYTPDRWPALVISGFLPKAASSLRDRVEAGVRVCVAAEGSVVPELVGTEWTAGSPPFTEVHSPDWAVLAWLLGRDVFLREAPPLRSWDY